MEKFIYMKRLDYLEKIAESWPVFPIVALLGPRQVGKTTLARQYAEQEYPTGFPPTNYFDLEDPTALARLSNPLLALQDLKGLVIIDEIQRQPELFPVLRVLADRPDTRARFLILGSASLDLVRNSSETLAGRVRYIEVMPLAMHEVPGDGAEKLWLRGGYPPSFLAASADASALWRDQYIRTFLERDIPQLGINIPAQAMRRFWLMLTHVHGQTLNYSELGRSLDISDATVRRYVDVLVGTFMVRRLAPWHANIAKRQVKAPKVYLRDSGLLHQLWGIKNAEQLQTYPRLGASWEGYALEEVVRGQGYSSEDVYFWAVHEQAELDLLATVDGALLGFEFKYTDQPKLTKSMSAAVDLLNLKRLVVVYPGNLRFPLSERVEAVPLSELAVVKMA